MLCSNVSRVNKLKQVGEGASDRCYFDSRLVIYQTHARRAPDLLDTRVALDFRRFFESGLVFLNNG